MLNQVINGVYLVYIATKNMTLFPCCYICCYINNIFFLPFILILEGKVYYGVRIINGSMDGSGTNDKGVYIILVGDQASTESLRLLDDMDVLEGIKSSTHYDFLVESEPALKDLQVVVLGNAGGGISIGASWYVDSTITYRLADKSEKKFPCSHWIGDKDMVSTTSKASK